MLGQELGDGTQGQLNSAHGVWAPVGGLEAGARPFERSFSEPDSPCGRPTAWRLEEPQNPRKQVLSMTPPRPAHSSTGPVLWGCPTGLTGTGGPLT